MRGDIEEAGPMLAARSSWAYAHAAAQLSEWLEVKGLSLAELEPPEAAAYIKTLEVEGKAPTTIKARLSALSNLCDDLASSEVLDWNPFKVVKGPRMSRREGLTPILEPEMVRALLGSFEESDVVTLRDRAIASTMLFSFARVGGGDETRRTALRAAGVEGVVTAQ